MGTEIAKAEQYYADAQQAMAKKQWGQAQLLLGLALQRSPNHSLYLAEFKRVSELARQGATPQPPPNPRPTYSTHSSPSRSFLSEAAAAIAEAESAHDSTEQVKSEVKSARTVKAPFVAVLLALLTLAISLAAVRWHSRPRPVEVSPYSSIVGATHAQREAQGKGLQLTVDDGAWMTLSMEARREKVKLLYNAAVVEGFDRVLVYAKDGRQVAIGREGTVLVGRDPPVEADASRGSPSSAMTGDQPSSPTSPSAAPIGEKH